MLNEARELLKKKSKGEKWVTETLPILVAICSKIKEIEAEKEERYEPLKIMMKGISEEYEADLKELNEVNIGLRQFILGEHEGTESVHREGVGTLVFPQRWGFDITDLSKVDRKYLTVDNKKVNEAIKAGLTNIKGLKVEKKKGLEVRIEKSES